MYTFPAGRVARSWIPSSDFPRASFEHRRIDRERYLAANPEIEAEIAALYQGKPVPRGQPDALPRPPKPLRGNAGNGRDQNAITMSKSVTL